MKPMYLKNKGILIFPSFGSVVETREMGDDRVTVVYTPALPKKEYVLFQGPLTQAVEFLTNLAREYHAVFVDRLTERGQS